METNSVTEAVIGAAIAVHRALGPGLLESAYEQCMVIELEARGLNFQEQQRVPLVYRGVPVDSACRIDLLVEKQVVVELKAVAKLDEVHVAQLITYLKLTGCTAGLLLNFNVPVMKLGIRRVVHGFPDQPQRLGASAVDSAAVSSPAAIPRRWRRA